MKYKNVEKFINSYFGWLFLILENDLEQSFYDEVIEYCLKSHNINLWNIAGGIYYINKENDDKYDKAIEILNKSKIEENIEAKLYLGMIYLDDNNPYYNYEKGKEIYKSLLNCDEPIVYYTIYSECEENEILKSDLKINKNLYTKAIKLLEDKAKANPKYQFLLGFIYDMDLKTKDKADHWLKRSANNGFECAQIYFAEKMETEIEDENQAKPWYELAAKQENIEALRWLGEYYSKYNHKDIDKAKKYLKIGVDSGDIECKVLLGRLYIENFTSVEESLKGVKLIEEAASHGDEIAITKLASMYEKGIVVEENKEKALKLYKKARYSDFHVNRLNLEIGNKEEVINDLIIKANNNDYNAIWELGHIYSEGKYAQIDLDKAEKYFKKGAMLGSSFYKKSLGDMYYKGDLLKKDLVKALYWYLQVAEEKNYYDLYIEISKIYNELNDIEKANYYMEKGLERINNHIKEEGGCSSQWTLGMRYLEGNGIPKDINKGLYFLELAASQTIGLYDDYLSDLYISGMHGVPVNYEKAIYWLKKEISKGNNYAYSKLGKLYIRDLNNFEEGLKYLIKGIELGNSYCALEVGRMYHKGVYVEKDLEKSEKYYELALKGSSLYILNYVCEKYFEEDFKKYDRALELLEVAGSKGHISSQYSLGKIYYDGIYVEKDIEKAYKWISKAYKKGLESCEELYYKIKNELEIYRARNTLHLTKRKDVFISWNHLDIELKEEIYKKLEENNVLTVWESDGSGNGILNDVIVEAINKAKTYLIILTKNSIKSEWVEKEIALMFENVEKTNSHNKIIPLIMDDEVYGLIEKMENSTFKKLLNYAGQFTNNGIINYDNLIKIIKDSIEVTLLREYKEVIKQKYNKFIGTITNVIETDNDNNIMSTTLDFNKCYLNRGLYQNNTTYKVEDILKNKISLIYGIGGTGKSLYLKNILRNYFNTNRYIFYIQCKEVINYEEEIIDILKTKAFNNSFPDDYQISKKGFERIFNNENDIIILVDALDEINNDDKKNLLIKISNINNKYKNIRYIFTSRNKSDFSLIEKELQETVNAYELKGINLEECNNLYDNIYKKYSDNEKLTEKDIENKRKFFEILKSVNNDIKHNPLLLSNMIFIYLATKELPKTEYEIVNKAIKILTSQIDKEKDITFKYAEYVKGDKLNDLLGYFAYQRASGNKTDIVTVFEKHIEEKYELGNESKNVAKEIYIFLRQRAIISNENISHEIYKEYYITNFLFNKIYELKENEFFEMYYDYSKSGFKLLSNVMNKKLSADSLPWPYIASNFITKVDYEIHKVNNLDNMDSTNPSYAIFNELLLEAFINKTYSNRAIEITKTLIDKKLLWYFDFIKKYIK